MPTHQFPAKSTVEREEATHTQPQHTTHHNQTMNTTNDAAEEAALILNNQSAVMHYMDIVVIHDKCFEDKLHYKKIYLTLHLFSMVHLFTLHVCQA